MWDICSFEYFDFQRPYYISSNRYLIEIKDWSCVPVAVDYDTQQLVGRECTVKFILSNADCVPFDVTREIFQKTKSVLFGESKIESNSIKLSA